MPLRSVGLALAAALSAAAPAAAQGVVERSLSAPGPGLDRPLVFDVYKPATAPADGRRWPVIYLLEGRPGVSDWFDQGRVAEVVEQAIVEGRIPPSLVVVASSPFSWYVDNPDPGGQGPVATALTRDLVDAVDARFPTAACREGRAIGGLSMGGYGAARLALENPGRYVAAMSFSGAIAPPIAPGDDPRLARAAPFYDGAFGRPMDRGRFNRATVFSALEAARGAAGPKPAILLAAGDGDRGGLLLATTRLHVELRRAGFDATLRIAPGAHDWPTWRAQLADALAWLGPRLDPSCAGEVARAAPHAGVE